MLIYHSHAGETYSDSPEGNYHSQNNKDKSVVEVGTLLTEQLSQKGWGIATVLNIMIILTLLNLMQVA